MSIIVSRIGKLMACGMCVWMSIKGYSMGYELGGDVFMVLAALFLFIFWMSWER